MRVLALKILYYAKFPNSVSGSYKSLQHLFFANLVSLEDMAPSYIKMLLPLPAVRINDSGKRLAEERIR